MTAFEWVCTWGVCITGAGAIAFAWDWIGRHL